MTTIKDDKWRGMVAQVSVDNSELRSKTDPIINKMLGDIGVSTHFNAPDRDQAIVKSVGTMAKHIAMKEAGARVNIDETPSDEALAGLIAKKLTASESPEDDAKAFVIGLRRSLEKAIGNGIAM